MKKIIIMQPGPLHLFWTTGVFYFWQLKKHCDFVFIVPDNYRNSKQFTKLATLDSICHIEYMPEQGIIRRHLRYRRSFKKILQMYRPACIFMHNRSYVDNQYLLYWVRHICPDATRYYYQNGRMSLMWQDDFAARHAESINRLLQKYSWFKFLPLAGSLVKIRNSLAFLLNFKLLPLFLCGVIFRPPVNIFTGVIDPRATDKLSNNSRDNLLAYLDNEVTAYRTQGIKNILQIKHPVTECVMNVFEFLYGDFRESDRILILPSYGFTARMLESGWQPGDVVSHVAGKWCTALEQLGEKFPGFELRMKLHPASVNDPLWQDIIKIVLLRFPSLQIIPTGESAEWHVVQSRVIVGDVTSVLWWAGMLGGKVVISLDIFDYPGGGELKLYPGLIHYVNNLEMIPLNPLLDDMKGYPSICDICFTSEG